MRILRFSLIAILIASSVLACRKANDRSVLMPASEASQVSGFFAPSSKIEGTWEPAASDLDGLESRLSEISKLRSEEGIPGAQIARPGDFYRQYFPVIVKGRKLIFISAFSSGYSPPPTWRTKPVLIYDGGAGVWGVIYDPSRGQFEHLKTDGVI
jgi:hypothetical protein